MSDHRLDDVLPAARLGQPWALRVLYDELSPQVHGYLRARGATEPEDLTSEVFLGVLPRLDTVTGGAAGLRTLVFSIAHARLVDHLRARSRRPSTVEYDPRRDERTAPSSEDAALALLADDRVREVLSGLPDDQRDVLLLRVVHDLSLEQTAQVIGRSTGAVKQLQRRAILALRARAEKGAVTR